jgi:hypothetical protein
MKKSRLFLFNLAYCVKTDFSRRLVRSFLGYCYKKRYLLDWASYQHNGTFNLGIYPNNPIPTAKAINVIFYTPHCAGQIDGLIWLQCGFDIPIFRSNIMTQFLGSVCERKRANCRRSGWH